MDIINFKTSTKKWIVFYFFYWYLSEQNTTFGSIVDSPNPTEKLPDAVPNFSYQLFILFHCFNSFYEIYRFNMRTPTLTQKCFSNFWHFWQSLTLLFAKFHHSIIQDPLKSKLLYFSFYDIQLKISSLPWDITKGKAFLKFR